MTQGIAERFPDVAPGTVTGSTWYSRTVEAHLGRGGRFLNLRNLVRNFPRRDEHVIGEITLYDRNCVLARDGCDGRRRRSPRYRRWKGSHGRQPDRLP